MAYSNREVTQGLRGTGKASAEEQGAVVAPWARTPSSLRAFGHPRHTQLGEREKALLRRIVPLRRRKPKAEAC
jgi:hypothetical protein